MHLRKVSAEMFRAAVDSRLTVTFPGRFSLVVGTNGAGKTTIKDAIYWGHRERYPRVGPPDSAVLRPAPPTRSIEYELESDPDSAKILSCSASETWRPPCLT